MIPTLPTTTCLIVSSKVQRFDEILLTVADQLQGVQSYCPPSWLKLVIAYEKLRVAFSNTIYSKKNSRISTYTIDYISRSDQFCKMSDVYFWRFLMQKSNNFYQGVHHLSKVQFTDITDKLLTNYGQIYRHKVPQNRVNGPYI